MDTEKSSVLRRTHHPEVLAGDPFAYARERDRSHQECVEAMYVEEGRLGRTMTPRERDAFARTFHAPAYRAHAAFLAAMGVLDKEGDEDEE